MLSLDQIAKIAELARLELPAAAAAALQQELNGILAMVDRMQAVDTRASSPCPTLSRRCSGCAKTKRASRTCARSTRHAAPATEDGFYLVPKVIE
jgi:aspartyl-tRNA(Asn)/glutamyl-tRNA(Gln) amidotransferase subunit C